MTDMNVVLKCNKCLKFKTPYDEVGKALMKQHLKECKEIPLKPADITVDKL